MAKCNRSTATSFPSTLFLSTLCWCSLQLNFLCPFQLKHSTLRLPFKGTVCFVFSCDPQRILGLDCVYIEVPPTVYGQGVGFTSVTPREMSGTFVSTFYPRVVCSSITAGLKHVGGGKAGDCFSYYRLRMDISIMSLFVIHDNTTLYWGRESIPS